MAFRPPSMSPRNRLASFAVDEVCLGAPTSVTDPGQNDRAIHTEPSVHAPQSTPNRQAAGVLAAGLRGAALYGVSVGLLLALSLAGGIAADHIAGWY